jgi:hypothetical protein
VVVLNIMDFMLKATLLALAGQAVGQLVGRGFPNCNTAPLKNNKVCDTSLGMLERYELKSSYLRL